MLNARDPLAAVEGWLPCLTSLYMMLQRLTSFSFISAENHDRPEIVA